MFKKGLIAVSLLVGALGIAQADTSTVISNLTKHERMMNSVVTVDAKMTAVIKEKYPSIDGYVVDVSGSRLLSNNDGTLIYQLASVFDTATMENLQTVVNYEIMEEPGNSDWFTVPLPADSEKRADIYVFSDPTCGYCRKMHGEKAKYDEYGVQMHIIPYPRQGLTEANPGYTQWVEAACSVDGGEAYHQMTTGTYTVSAETTEKLNDPVAKAACVAKVRSGYALGREVGLRGTPFIIGYGSNGERMMTPGYVPIDEIAKQLGALSSE